MGAPTQALTPCLMSLADGPDLRMEHAPAPGLGSIWGRATSELVQEFFPDAEHIFLAPSQTKSGVTQRRSRMRISRASRPDSQSSSRIKIS